MPAAGAVNSTERLENVSRLPKGIFSLVLTVLLCLPSLIGGTVFLLNLVLYRGADEWGRVSGALVAMGGILGRPLVALAAVVGASIAFRRNVSPRIIYGHLLLVTLGTVASLFFLFRLGV